MATSLVLKSLSGPTRPEKELGKLHSSGSRAFQPDWRVFCIAESYPELLSEGRRLPKVPAEGLIGSDEVRITSPSEGSTEITPMATDCICLLHLMDGGFQLSLG